MKEFLNKNNIDNKIITGLAMQNIKTLTEVQKMVIPEMINNKDLVVQSETGTGKTLAYLIPLFNKIDSTKKEMQGIILTPTHELAIQVLRQIELLSLNSQSNVTSIPIIGKVNIERQKEKLRKKPHIIVGSPGRILELIKMRKIGAHTIKTIIIDEADSLLNKNNYDYIKAIIKSTQRDRQVLLFSASITNETKVKAKELTKDAQYIVKKGHAKTPDTIEHMLFMSKKRDKITILRKILRIMKPKKAMIFVNKKEDIDIFTSRLIYHGHNAGGLHGDKLKKERQQTMDKFRRGKLEYLVVTDIAARGLDIENITHIINIDIPEKTKGYLHRVGRSGRMGNKGVAISIVSENEIQFINLFKKELKIDILAKIIYENKITTVTDQ